MAPKDKFSELEGLNLHGYRPFYFKWVHKPSGKIGKFFHLQKVVSGGWLEIRDSRRNWSSLLN